MKAGSVVLGVAVLWAAGGLAQADGLPTGLTGLDVEMNGTGRIADPWQQSQAPIAAPRIPDAPTHKVAPAPAATRYRDDPARPPQRGELSEHEYRQTDVAVGNCRIEVARRRQVAPASLAAGTVLLRFTVEASGRVRDAEAVSETNTDLEVAACAKRVLSEWRFAKHSGAEFTVERVYRLIDGDSSAQRQP